jgi:hypothetical protein
MAAAVHRATTTPDGVDQLSSWVVTKPAGAVENDLVLVALAIDGPITTITSVPSGWVAVDPPVQSSWPQTLAVYAKVLGASEPADWTWGMATLRSGVASAIAYSGVDTADPINAAAALVAPNDAEGPFRYDTDEITTTVDDCVLLAVFAMTSLDGVSWVVPGMTDRGDVYEGAFTTSLSLHELAPTAGPAEQALVAGSYSKTGTATANGIDVGAETYLIAIAPAAGTPAAPVCTVDPVASGEPVGGQVVSVTNGSWTGDTTPVLTYQWRRGPVGSAAAYPGGSSTAISGATSSSYTMTVDDVGGVVFCVVTGTNAAGSDSEASNELGPAELAPPAPDCFMMTAAGFTATRGRVMSSSGLVPPA